MVNMIDVAHVAGRSWNLLSIFKAVELIYHRRKVVWGFLGKESPIFNFFSRKGFFSATGVIQVPCQEMALGVNLAENGPRDECGGNLSRYEDSSHDCAPERTCNAENQPMGGV